MENKQDNNYPLEIRDVEPDETEMLIKYFTGVYPGFVRVGPKGYFLQHGFRKEAFNIYSMDIRPTDVFVISYPRSGTTWTQELVWMVANDLDYEKAKTIPLIERFPYLECSINFFPKMIKQIRDKYCDTERKLKCLEYISQPVTEQLAASTLPRFVKTHLPLSLLPPSLLDTAKVIYVARDPRDVAVSYFHLNSTMSIRGYIGDFKTYWKFFINDSHYFTPYFQHLKECWEKRHHPNMIFLFYEELSKDLRNVINRVSKFLGKNFTEQQIDQLCDHLSYDNFKINKSINCDEIRELGLQIPGKANFIRNGKTGNWRDYFDDEMTAEADKWISDNLKDTDFRFPHMACP
ncbi:luciferin sulfotransferase-like [Vanessa cardui]|uniref:luciferin sulfotransferase-like n=1 Tax=Vanessa cardui TaxID=171605 RepID=UPI001F1453E5|nr:luciferin sulfotransferase-like [Vanessa cardui]